MKNNIIILCLILLVTAGCRQIVFWKYDMHAPAPETPQSLTAFLGEMKQPLVNQFIFSDSASYLKFIWDPFFSKHLMNTVFYNEAGFLKGYVDTVKCQWSGGYYIARLKKDTIFTPDTSNRYQSLLKALIPLGSTGEATDTGNYDYTLVVTWGKFIGKYNERLFANDLAVRQNLRVKIRILYVNIDMQAAWHLRKEQMLLFK